MQALLSLSSDSSLLSLNSQNTAIMTQNTALLYPRWYASAGAPHDFVGIVSVGSTLTLGQAQMQRWLEEP